MLLNMHSKEGIRITFQTFEKEMLQLGIADNGIGLPADFSSSINNSMGMTLIKGLTKQLSGKFDLNTGYGTIITTSMNK